MIRINIIHVSVASLLLLFLYRIMNSCLLYPFSLLSSKLYSYLVCSVFNRPTLFFFIPITLSLSYYTSTILPIFESSYFLGVLLAIYFLPSFLSLSLSCSAVFLIFFKYHQMICWMSFSRSLGPQLPRRTTIMGSIPFSQQKTEPLEFINWFSSQFLQTLKQDRQGLSTVLFFSSITRVCRAPSPLIYFIYITFLGSFRISRKQGIFKHSADKAATSEAEHLFTYLFLLGSASTYLIFSIFMVWQQLLTSSQNSARCTLNIFSSASYTLQYSFLLFFSRQAPMFTATISSYSSPSSISSRWIKCSRVRISSTLSLECLQNLMTEPVTMVWNLVVSILCLVMRVLMVQKTRSLENTDSSCRSWARQPRTQRLEQQSQMTHLGALTVMILVGSRNLPEFRTRCYLLIFFSDFNFS